jgi:hypothetical protein
MVVHLEHALAADGAVVAPVRLDLGALGAVAHLALGPMLRFFLIWPKKLEKNMEINENGEMEKMEEKYEQL